MIKTFIVEDSSCVNEFSVLDENFYAFLIKNFLQEDY